MNVFVLLCGVKWPPSPVNCDEWGTVKVTGTQPGSVHIIYIQYYQYLKENEEIMDAGPDLTSLITFSEWSLPVSRSWLYIGSVCTSVLHTSVWCRLHMHQEHSLCFCCHSVKMLSVHGNTAIASDSILPSFPPYSCVVHMWNGVNSTLETQWCF